MPASAHLLRALHAFGRRTRLPTARLAWSLSALAVAAYATVPHVALDAPPPPAQTPAVQADPATGIEFPTTLKIPSRLALPPFTLVGTGVRTVSFLGLKVYSVGFYADLSNPALNLPADASFDDKIAHLVNNTACVLRIIPTRSTNFTHLRDGFVRTMQARLKLAHERGQLTKEDEGALVTPLHKLKSMFPNAPLQKHAFLDIILNPPQPSRPRTVIFRDIGRIESDWVATQFFLAYFEGTGISPPMKQDVQRFLSDRSLPQR